jgi:hypothetical protein
MGLEATASIRAASCHYASERPRDDLFAFLAMTSFIDSRYSFLPLPKCDRWWERAEQAKTRIGWTVHLWPKFLVNFSPRSPTQRRLSLQICTPSSELVRDQNKSGQAQAEQAPQRKDFDSAAGQPS